MFFWSFRYIAVWDRGCLQIMWAKTCLQQKQNWPTIGYSLTMAQLTKAGQSYLGKALNCWKTKQWQLCSHFHEWQLWKMLVQWSGQHRGMYPGAGLSSIRFTILLPPRQSPPQLLKGWAHSQALLMGYFSVHWVLPIAFFRSGWATSDQTFTGVLRIMSILWEVWRNGTWYKGWAFGYRMLPVQKSIRCNDLLIQLSVEVHWQQEPKTGITRCFWGTHKRENLSYICS